MGGSGSERDKGRAILLVIIIGLIIAICVCGVMLWKMMRGSGQGEDFWDLVAENDEVIAWLTVDDTAIDTPVAQADNNTKYLNTDARGKQTLTGCPFLDYRNSPDFTDRYSIVYGHNVEDHLMFGDLELFTDEEFWKEERTGRLLLKDRTEYDIEFFACVKTKEDDSRYFDPRKVRNNWNEDYLEELTENALVAEDSIDMSDNVLVLSTCKEADSKERILLIGRLKPTGE